MASNPPILGMLLTRGPGTREADWSLRIARTAAANGHPVRLFLMDDGAELLGHEELAAARSAGVRVLVCSRTATQRDLPLDAEGVDYAGQHQLAQIVAGSDRFLSFP